MPTAFVTDTSPDAPEATTAVIVVAFTTVNEVAATTPKLTDVAPVKFTPVIVTVAPLAAELGEKEMIPGEPALFLKTDTSL